MAGSDPRQTRSVTIANGASITSAIKVGTNRVAGVVMPAAWTAANLTFQGSADGGTTFNDLYNDDGTEVTVTATTSRAIAFGATLTLALAPYGTIKVRSGTSAVAVNQGADRTLTLVLTPA